MRDPMFRKNALLSNKSYPTWAPFMTRHQINVKALKMVSKAREDITPSQLKPLDNHVRQIKCM